jgi:hypothetical protein
MKNNFFKVDIAITSMLEVCNYSESIELCVTYSETSVYSKRREISSY